MSLANTVNLNAATPAPATGAQNIVFADDSGTPTVNISATDPVMVGDSGSGGAAGNVPAPGAGSAAAGKFLKADGTFAVPAGTGIGTFTVEDVTFSGTSGSLAHTPSTLIGIFRNGVIMSATSGSSSIQKYSITGAAITLSVTAGSDWFYAVYFHA